MTSSSTPVRRFGTSNVVARDDRLIAGTTSDLTITDPQGLRAG
jgi:hypothetical protein